MAGARRRVLGPGHAGFQPCDPPTQRLLAFVEYRQLVVPGMVVLDIAVGTQDRDRLARPRIAVAARPHPVADIVGEQFQPFAEAALVEQPCLAVEELLDLADHLVTHGGLLRWRGRSAPRPAVGGEQLRPAAIEPAMVALADAMVAGPGVEASVEVFVTHAHLRVDRHAARHDPAAGLGAFLPIVHIVLLEGAGRAEAAYPGEA